MAIEKMKIVSITGKLGDLDKASRLAVINGSIHVLNALSELNSNSLNISASQEHVQTFHELAHLRPYTERRDFSKDEVMIKFFQELFGLKPVIDRSYVGIGNDYEAVIEELRKVSDDVKHIYDEMSVRNERIKRLERQLVNTGYLKNTGIRLEQVRKMSFMSFRLLLLSNENYKKLMLNIENVPSIVLQTAVTEGNTVIATITPVTLWEEAERIFASVNYKELELPEEFGGTVEEVARQVSARISEEKSQVEELKRYVNTLGETYRSMATKAYTLLELEKRAEKVKLDSALGNSMFFIFGFVPERGISTIRDQYQQKFGDEVLLIIEDAEENRQGHVPPTKIKNNRLFAPFETLIGMYGIPSYGEKDPTPFFAVSYMLLFGAMFGDLGQGLVILLGGLLVGRKMKNSGFGGILTRLGASSMVFGALYGSIFGSEEIIEPLLIRPMANINTMLISAILLGIILITISYIYSLINLYSFRNIEEGLFGREGLAGFMFFLVLLLGAWGKLTGRLAGVGIPLIAAIVLLLIMVFKQPLTGLLTGHKLYEESPMDYYIEAGFGVIETVLSVASNIISFIRVGAFALNHVGLYVAFATMAHMLHSKAGGITVIIIGNIFIIGLEGLIVFIQSLRLEYYELFSKYYTGYGVEYKPASLVGDINGEV